MEQTNKEFKFKNFSFKVYLGNKKGTGDKIYLDGFSWDCNWYYGGGYLNYYHGRVCDKNQTVHTHFESVFLHDIIKNNQIALWFDLSDIVDNAQFDSNQWWRIKDLYKQFYTLKEAAEVFIHGGHCISKGRNKKEINLDMNYKINEHIQNIIIPEIIKALNINIENNN